MLPMFPEMAEANEFFALLVPEPEAERFEAAEKRERFYLLKHQMRFVASLQIVIRNSRAQMVDVVIADVSGEPLQYFRQFVERAAFQGGRSVIPLRVALPINSLELMLHVKQPEAG